MYNPNRPTLDEVLNEITETTNGMGAEWYNTLHGCRSDHPWGDGKTFKQRKDQALWACMGRTEINSKLFKRLHDATE